MAQYEGRNATSSFNDVMQQWPGEKNDRYIPFRAENNDQHFVSFGEFCF